jgi:hypothetical protein
MIAPPPIVNDPAVLLAEVRGLLSLRPTLSDYPERLAAWLEADEQDVQNVLEALRVEGEVLA